MTDVSTPKRMGEAEPEEVFELMADEYAREILALTSQQAMSARDLVEKCDASERTIYRRLDQLQSLGVVTDAMQLDPAGHHRTVYEAVLETVRVDLNDGQYDVRIQLKEDTADRFARMWRDIRDE